MWCHNDMVQTVYEYASNKVILSLDPTDMLIIDRWKPVRIIPNIFCGNIEKFFISPHPEFNEYEFPFLICSGFDFFVLINIKTYKLEKFVD